MPKALVIFGPPSSGKGFILSRELRNLSEYQVISVDKDVLNSEFFIPKLDKDITKDAFKILGMTTHHLVELSSHPEYINKFAKDLVIILQGATLGGIVEDIITLLEGGFEVHIELLSVPPAILKTRIDKRSKDPKYYGAPPRSIEELKEDYRKSHSDFENLLSVKRNYDPSNPVAFRSEQLARLRQVIKNLTFSVELTSYPESFPGKSRPDIEGLFVRDEFTEDEITIMPGSLILNDGAGQLRIVPPPNGK